MDHSVLTPTIHNLGLDSYQKDDFVSAKKFWQEALKIDPKYLQARRIWTGWRRNIQS